MNEEQSKSDSNDNAEKVISLAEYEELQARLAELEGMKEKMVRSAADFENAKKRLQRDKEDFAKYAQENLFRDLLPALDNLERALRHSKEDEATLKNVVKGVEVVAKHFLDTLKKQGLQRFQSLGEVFDPHRHEIMVTTEGSGKDHEILEEIEPGYMLHDRVLRVARVRVRVAPSSEPTAPNS
jgi:molecular chaperone GrpE